ncbi:MAG: hypothetical protein D6681_12035 [Calditrichaeota bacterium]|nr:MAG: hypothetical protein D6681_12035 [Calditrichota bacterium]
MFDGISVKLTLMIGERAISRLSTKKWPHPRWLLLAGRVGFGLLLIGASIDKILHPVTFAYLVSQYKVLSPQWSRWVALWLPYLELLTGLMLLAGIWLETTTAVTAGLMTLFLGAVAQAYWRGLPIACGCFSTTSGEPIGPGKIVENVLLSALAWGLWVGVRRASRRPETTRVIHPDGAEHPAG